MSGLFTTLNNSVKALNAHSRAIEIAGKNLANVNNTAYARQRVQYGDRGTVITPSGAESLGLEALSVQQVRDALLDKQLTREIALSGSYTAQQQAYERAQASLGQNITATTVATKSTGTGLGESLDKFFNSFESLAASPTDQGERATLLQRAAVLVDTIRLTDTRLAQVQADLGTQIETDVASANNLLSSIADLNRQIASVEIAAPNSALDLRDQRQAKIEELAAKLPINVSTGTNGMLNVSLPDSGGAAVLLVDGANTTGPVAFTGTAITGGAAATTLNFSSGSVYGALAARDEGVQALRDNLDALAEQIVTSVNAAYNPSSTPGGDFFVASGTTAGTIALRSGLTPANLVTGASGAAGDNSIALAVAALANKTFSVAGSDSINGTFRQAYASMVSEIGQSVATATLRAENQDSIQILVRSQRDAISGVSLDEEMSDLVRFQRAFQASSRVFSIVDELLDNVVNGLGR